MNLASAVPQGGAAAGCAVTGDARASAPAVPTIWGLTPLQLHDRFWASRGIQVVRGGSEDVISTLASLYLLTDPNALVLFDPAFPNARDVELLYVSIRDTRDSGLRERVVTNAAGRFVRFERLYNRPRRGMTRAALTRNPALAAAWQAGGGWKKMRLAVRKPRRRAMERDGSEYNGAINWEVAAFVRDLAGRWGDPSRAVGRASRMADGIWRDRDAVVHTDARLVRPVWVGRGRHADAGTMVIGPSILWDDPAQRPAPEPFAWAACNPRLQSAGRPTPVKIADRRRRFYPFFKRLFDVAFSLLALAAIFSLSPFIVAAIVLEDGWPFLFRHRRETIGGREFECLKFRSMRRNAEAMRIELRHRNQADGPQFYIQGDPRLTRVGRWLRRLRIDEWPQFWNVLTGAMSIVGPRPSPFKENQFCPAWRKLRLSVRPGITGLWQVKRTRAPGADFQEWIRYDIEYVETACWTGDLCILWKTLRAVLRRG